MFRMSLFPVSKHVLADELMHTNIYHGYFPGDPEVYVYSYESGKASGSQYIQDNFFENNAPNGLIGKLHLGLMYSQQITPWLSIQLAYTRFRSSGNFFESHGIVNLYERQFSCGLSWHLTKPGTGIE